MSDCSVLLRGADGRLLGQVDSQIDAFTFDGTVRGNDIGAAQLKISANHRLSSVLLGEYCEIVVVRHSDERVLFSGPVKDASVVSDPSGTMITATFAEMTQWLQWRVCHPYAGDSSTSPPRMNPDFPALAGSTLDDVRGVFYPLGINATGPVSSVVWYLVEFSVGVSAAPERRVASFAQASDPQLGADVRNLGVSYATGPVWPFTVEQLLRENLWAAMIDDRFTIRPGVDRSGRVIFRREQAQLLQDPDSGPSLIDYTYRASPPGATAVYAVSDADTVSNVGRHVVEVSTPALVARWGWIESFADENTVAYTDAATDLAPAAEKTLTAQRGAESVDMNTREGPVYGVDYEIGDLVTADLDVLTFVARVAQVRVTGDESGWAVVPALGERVLLRRDPSVLTLGDHETRLARLENA